MEIAASSRKTITHHNDKNDFHNLALITRVEGDLWGCS